MKKKKKKKERKSNHKISPNNNKKWSMTQFLALKNKQKSYPSIDFKKKKNP